MIAWIIQFAKDISDCARLKKRVAALEDDLADALSRYQAASARERDSNRRLFEAHKLLEQERETSAAYRRMNARLELEIAGRDEIDEMLRDAEGGVGDGSDDKNH